MQRRRSFSTTRAAIPGILALVCTGLLSACAGSNGEDAFGASVKGTPDEAEAAPSTEGEQATLDALNDAAAALKEATQALDEAAARASEVMASEPDDSTTLDGIAADSPSPDEQIPAPIPSSADPNSTAADANAEPAMMADVPATAGVPPQDPAPPGEPPSTGDQAASEPGAPVPDAANPPQADTPAVEPPVAPPLPDPLFSDPLCSTDSYWTSGKDDRMRPGEACISCHTREGEGPAYTIAGTIYATGHEPDDCHGVSGAGPEAVTIVITDAKGAELALTPNAVGNFTLRDQIALPYTAKVISTDGERIMLAPQTVGDCNACHTADGIGGAPGRITLPF